MSLGDCAMSTWFAPFVAALILFVLRRFAGTSEPLGIDKVGERDIAKWRPLRGY